MTNNLEQLPFIADLEFSLMTAFLQDRKLWVKMFPHIKQGYFKNKTVGRMFKICATYFEKFKEFPTLDQMHDFANRINMLDEMSPDIKRVYDQRGKLQGHEIAFLADECNKFVKEQKIKNALIKGVDLLNDGKYDEIESEMRTAVSWNSDIKLGTLIHQAKERYDSLDELYGKIIPWPWDRLKMFSEGMLSKQLYVIISSSSVGKSIFLDNVAWATWYGLKKNVVSITLELSELKKGQRMDAFGMKMEMKTLRDNKNKVIKFYDDNVRDNRLFIKEFPTSAATVNKDFRNYLYNLELYAGLHPSEIDLLVVDYGDIVKPRKPTGQLFQDQGSVFEEMRALGVEFDFPVLTACLKLNTIVERADGKKIEIKDVKIGDKLKTNNGINNVTNVFPITKRKVYKIKTKSGKEIICSEKHVFPTKDGEKNIKNGLKKGDILFIKV